MAIWQWLSRYGPKAFSQPGPGLVWAHTCAASTLLRHANQGAGPAAAKAQAPSSKAARAGRRAWSMRALAPRPEGGRHRRQQQHEARAHADIAG
jgi:hypothetical protein